MKRKRPSRVTMTLPPSRLRASSSRFRLCRRSLSESPCCSLSSATSTRHSSRLRGGSVQSATRGTLRGRPDRALDLEQMPLGAEVEDLGRPHLALDSPGLVDVPADRELRVGPLDRLQDRLAAEVVAGAAHVAVS